MTYYRIHTADTISEQHIYTILTHWEVLDWNNLTAKKFREKFAKSEFHLLTNENLDLLSIARINFDFSIQIQECVYKISEFVGFVSFDKGKGYGTALLTHLIKNLQERKMETIGFCEKSLRPFYKKAHIEILYDSAKQLREREGNIWVVPKEDDDVLCIHVSDDTMEGLKSLSSENVGYLIFGP